MITSGAKDSPSAAMSTVPFANALMNLDVTQTGRPGFPSWTASGHTPFLESQTDSMNSLTATGLSLLLCPRYLDKLEQRGKRNSELPTLPFGTSQAMQSCSQVSLELQLKQHGEPATELLLEWILFAQSGACLKCPRGSPTLPPFSSPQLQAPGG